MRFNNGLLASIPITTASKVGLAPAVIARVVLAAASVLAFALALKFRIIIVGLPLLNSLLVECLVLV